MPLDLPEIDLSLTPNIKAAHRHLALLEPYLPPFDKIDVPYASDPADAKPLNHPTFTFVIKSDVDGRDDHPVRMTGMLQELKDGLHAANTTSRSGIFVELPAEACIAVDVRLTGLPRVAVPVLPSMTVDAGRKSDGHRYETWAWLLSRAASKEERAAIVGALEAHGQVHEGETVLVRLSGFYSRVSQPFMVSVQGHLLDDGARHGMCFHPAELARSFAGEMATIE